MDIKEWWSEHGFYVIVSSIIIIGNSLLIWAILGLVN